MLEKILKDNSNIPELEKDPLLTKDDPTEFNKTSAFKLGDDGMLKKDGEPDESEGGIADKILKKMNENKEEEKKKEEDKKDEEPKTEEGKQSARAID